jgi:hypothetical protein
MSGKSFQQLVLKGGAQCRNGEGFCFHFGEAAGDLSRLKISRFSFCIQRVYSWLRLSTTSQ